MTLKFNRKCSALHCKKVKYIFAVLLLIHYFLADQSCSTRHSLQRVLWLRVFLGTGNSRKVWNNNWKSCAALCDWPGSWITQCGSNISQPSHCFPFCFLMSHGAIYKLCQTQKNPFLFIDVVSILTHGNRGRRAGVTSSTLTLLMISERKLWSGKEGFQILVSANFRDDPDIINIGSLGKLAD